MNTVNIRHLKAIKAAIEIAKSNLPADTEIQITVSARNSASLKISPLILEALLKEENEVS